MRLTALLLFLATALAGQPSFFDALHDSGDTALFTLDTEWRPLIRRKKDKIYQPVSLAVNGINLPGKIRTRGHMRLEVCHFPSLKVKLDQKALTDLGYSTLNDLKVVMQCNSKSMGEFYLRREKLMYDLHAIVSDFHHRTIPINLVIPGGDTIRGFLVESEEQLEARYGARIVEDDNVSTRALDRGAYLNMCLFNYLILNTDWSVYNRHNVECLLPTGAKSYVPIPYDFDYSGLVGTHYAVPHESMKILTVHDPKFLGRNITMEEFAPVAKNFLAHAAELRTVVEAYPELDQRSRKNILKRLEDFVEELSDTEALADLVEKQ